jgi:hypothetical protein
MKLKHSKNNWKKQEQKLNLNNENAFECDIKGLIPAFLKSFAGLNLFVISNNQGST